MLGALIIDDNDVSYQDVNSSNDVTMVNGHGPTSSTGLQEIDSIFQTLA